MDEVKVRVQFGPCCFCGLAIEPSAIDPCRMTVETVEQRWQVWFCHAVCFQQHLANDPMLEPAFF